MIDTTLENSMPAKTYRYFDVIMAAFVAVLLISNAASTKMVLLPPFTFDGGTILFPLAYIFGDVLTEVYGYQQSRKVIWNGFAWMAAAALIFAVVDWLPAPQDYPYASAFHNILGQTPRIVIASLAAYFAGEFSNSFILAKLKVRTAGKYLWVRTIGSTLVGEAVDTTLFILIAFWGVLPADLLWTVIVSNYVFKVAVETLFTPLTYTVVGFLKKHEGEDYYDRKTNFNPFGG